MAALVAPALTSPAGNTPDSSEGLACTLDKLLERYLNLLDQYQKLQQDLASYLSSGYLSLAQANFSNTNRIRYGSDYYDDRMQASTLVSLMKSPISFSATELSAAKSLEASKTGDVKGEKSLIKIRDASADQFDGNGEIRDPSSWFGILLPPALRASQRSFKVAVMDTIPALVITINEMKEVEIEVRRARKKLRKAG